VYAASKAFLYRFSRALRVELFSRKIKVTAVCPYWIRDTEFISVAEKEGIQSKIRHYPLSSKVHSVAVHSLMDSRLGLPVSTPGIVCTIHRVVAKVIPSELMMGIWAVLRRL
jgi:short-subunit dehydrogenase